LTKEGNAVDILEDYLAGTGELRAAYKGMTSDQLHARPVEGKWSAMEVLCHLIDTDLMTATRIRAALLGETPRLPAATIEELTAKLFVEARDAAEELTCFETIRSQTARIVRSLPESALDRDIILVKATGEEVMKTVSQLLTGITSHVKHHLAFVREKRKALGLAA
jgi:uncharacterized damage-inducible protein DinB